MICICLIISGCIFRGRGSTMLVDSSWLGGGSFDGCSKIGLFEGVEVFSIRKGFWWLMVGFWNRIDGVREWWRRCRGKDCFSFGVRVRVLCEIWVLAWRLFVVGEVFLLVVVVFEVCTQGCVFWQGLELEMEGWLCLPLEEQLLLALEGSLSLEGEQALRWEFWPSLGIVHHRIYPESPKEIPHFSWSTHSFRGSTRNRTPQF